MIKPKHIRYLRCFCLQNGDDVILAWLQCDLVVRPTLICAGPLGETTTVTDVTAELCTLLALL